MKIQPKIMVGMAVIASLALAGMLGIFSFGPAQTVQAQNATATRSFNPATATVTPGGQVEVMISIAGDRSSGAVTETLPAGFTYVSSSLDDFQVIEVSAGVRRFILQGDASFTYTVTASSTEREYTFSGTLRDSDRNDFAVGGATMVTVAADATDGTNVGEEDAPDRIKLSSDTAGDAVQVTINAMAATPLSSATDIVVDLKKFGVPSSIAENSININSSGQSPAYVGEPNSVTVNGTKVSLALYARFPGANSSAGDVRGDYTITIKQSAGITNPIVAGKATVTVAAADVTETFNPVIKSKVSLSATSGARGSGVTVSAVGIGAGGATVFLVKGDCPDKGTDPAKVLAEETNTDCTEQNDISLGNAESSGGKISVDVDNSSSDFVRGVIQIDKKGKPVSGRGYVATDSLRGLNRIAVVDGTGKTTNKDAWYQITPTIEVDQEGGKQGDELTILVEDWYYGDVYSVTVGDETASWDPNRASAVDIRDGDGEIDVLIPNAARLGEQELKVYGSSTNQEGSLTADGRDSAKGTVSVEALDIELDPPTIVLGQQFTVKIKGFSTEDPPADDPDTTDRNENQDIQHVKVGDITLSETTGGVAIRAMTIDTNGDFTNTFVVKSTYVDPDGKLAENVLDPGTYRVEVKDHTGRTAIGHMTFPEPEITIDPPVGRRGTTVSIVGRNFPAGRVVSLFYDDDDDDDLLSAILADSSGRFRTSFTVPSNAEIGEDQDILAISAANENKYKTKAVHSLPPQELVISPEAVSAGGRITIEGHNMPLFTLVKVLIADITVSGQGVETDGLGSFTIEDVLVPQLRPGSHTVEAQVQTQGEEPAKVRKVIQIVDIITRDSEEAFDDLIENATLTRVWHLDAATQTWSFFDPATEFADFNTLTEVSSGQIVTIIMSAQDDFQGKTLYVGSNNVAIE